MRQGIVAVWAALAVLTFCGDAVSAQVQYVWADVPSGGANDGSSWVNAYSNLQYALQNTGSGTNLWVARGVYIPGTNTSDTFNPASGVNLYGGFTNGMTALAERDPWAYPSILSGEIGDPALLTDNIKNIVSMNDANGILDGFTISRGYDSADTGSAVKDGVSNGRTYVQNCLIVRNGGTYAVYDNSAAANYTGMVLSNCVFAANTGCLYTRYPVSLMKNCLLLNNGTGNLMYLWSSSTIDGCTFAGNTSPIYVYQYTPQFKNSILVRGTAGEPFTGGASGQGTISYSDIWGGWTPGARWADGGSNLNVDPLFVGGTNGVWTGNGSYDAATLTTTLTDTNGSLAVNQMMGMWLNPNTNDASRTLFYVISNSSTQVVVAGDASALGTNGAPYQAYDYHLQSTVGHWKPADRPPTGTNWAADASSSPCIDAGDPGSSCANEPFPNGGFVNLGAYGNTAQASKSLDVTPPHDVADLVVWAGDEQLTLYWDNSDSADVDGTLVLRKVGSFPTGTPETGTNYVVTDTIGDGVVVYNGLGGAGAGEEATWPDTGLANGTHYYYKFFAFDMTANYANGVGTHSTPSAAAGGPIIYVDSQATGGNNGTSWSNAYNELAGAVKGADSGDDVWVARGVYLPGTDAGDAFEPASGVDLYGGFTNGMTSLSQRNAWTYPSILSGEIGDPADVTDNIAQIVKITVAADVCLDGLTLSRGYATGNGGSALYIAKAATIGNCLFTGNGGTYAIQNFAGVMNTVGESYSNCVFIANTGCLYNRNAKFSLKNSLFLNNAGTYLVHFWSSSTIDHCTFAGNTSPLYLYQQFPVFKNSILKRDTAGEPFTAASWNNGTVSYSDIWGGWTPSARWVDGGSNLNVNPLFVGGPVGSWTADGAYDAVTLQTTLTDSGGGWGANQMKGKWLNPNTNDTGRVLYYVISNTATQIVVAGDAGTVGTNTAPYRVEDYHLRSKEGHWTASGWVLDGHSSPCIDAADTNAPWGNEPSPNGERANMGAYGNTSRASRTFLTGRGIVFMLR